MADVQKLYKLARQAFKNPKSPDPKYLGELKKHVLSLSAINFELERQVFLQFV